MDDRLSHEALTALAVAFLAVATAATLALLFFSAPGHTGLEGLPKSSSSGQS